MVIGQLATAQIAEKRFSDADSTLSLVTDRRDVAYSPREVADAIRTRAMLALLRDEPDEAEDFCDRLDELQSTTRLDAAMGNSVAELRIRAAEISGDNELYIARLAHRWAERATLPPDQSISVGVRLMSAHRSAGSVDEASALAIELASETMILASASDGDTRANYLATARESLEWTARIAWRHGLVARSIEAISLLDSIAHTADDRRAVDDAENELIIGITD